MAANKRPIRSSAHRKEDESKRAFEKAIDPFFVTAWTQRDYGIDAIIEITTNSKTDIEIESKCFLAQLKSTEKVKVVANKISFPVQAKKILSWYNYNLPVLFALYDCTSECLYYRWIDELLIAQLDAKSPNWAKQGNVTLTIEQTSILDNSTLETIKGHVLKWKVPARRTLEPGKYFELRQRGQALLTEYKELVSPLNFSSVNEAIKNFELDIDLSLYRIALTGLSRVGKSSLINALLKKEVSPTGFYQTTGVPIQVIPGHENKLNIYFHNDTNRSLPFSLKGIEQYASQDLNEDNHKQVRLVSVSVKNDQLERGVSLFDIPGLDDPSEEVLDYTWQTIRKVNAIIYVIDASPAENGGYIFKNDYKRHITEFSSSQDKVFLVFNKVDRLSSATLKGLKERVKQDLTKHKLIEGIGDKIFYLSAVNDAKKKEVDTIDHLNDCLWEFILRENKSGIVKLNLLNQEIAKSSRSFTEILQTRLIDSNKRMELEKSIQTIRSKMPSLINALDVSCRIISESLENKKNGILLNLEKLLKETPADKPLPTSAVIKKYLADGRIQAIDHSNNEYALQINQLKVFVDEWIEEHLKHVRELLSANIDQRIIEFTEIETFEAPQADLSSAWGMGLIGVAVGIFITPFAAVAAGLAAFFGSLSINAGNMQANQIAKTLEKSRDRYETAFNKLKIAYSELMDEHIQRLNLYVNQNLNFFFSDLQAQIQQFDKLLSPAQMEICNKAFTHIEQLQLKLSDFDAELRSYQFIF
jgi:ribosome biogenesis GTPase A